MKYGNIFMITMLMLPANLCAGEERSNRVAHKVLAVGAFLLIGGLGLGIVLDTSEPVKSPVAPMCDLPWSGGIPNPNCYQIDISNGQRTHNFRPFCFPPNITEIGKACTSGLKLNVSKIQDLPWMKSCPYRSCIDSDQVKEAFPKVCASCFPENKQASVMSAAQSKFNKKMEVFRASRKRK